MVRGLATRLGHSDIVNVYTFDRHITIIWPLRDDYLIQPSIYEGKDGKEKSIDVFAVSLFVNLSIALIGFIANVDRHVSQFHLANKCEQLDFYVNYKSALSSVCED